MAGLSCTLIGVGNCADTFPHHQPLQELALQISLCREHPAKCVSGRATFILQAHTALQHFTESQSDAEASAEKADTFTSKQTQSAGLRARQQLQRSHSGAAYQWSVISLLLNILSEHLHVHSLFRIVLV